MGMYVIRCKYIKLNEDFLVFYSLKTQHILCKLLISLEIPKTSVKEFLCLMKKRAKICFVEETAIISVNCCSFISLK